MLHLNYVHMYILRPFIMARALKSKQTTVKSTPPLTTRSRTKALATVLNGTTGNPHHKNTKLWKEWEASNNSTSLIEPTSLEATPTLGTRNAALTARVAIEGSRLVSRSARPLRAQVESS